MVMRRFLPAAILAVLMVAAASPVNAGYLIIRVLLEGTGSSGLDSGTSPSGDPRIGGPMTGSSLGPSPGSVNPFSGGKGSVTTGGTTPRVAGTQDLTRSLVVVIPIETDLKMNRPFYGKFANATTNPNWKQLRMTHRGTSIVTNLFTDESTVQWYENLMETPADRRTREMDIRDKHARWARTKTDSKLLHEVILSALDVGLVDEALAYADQLLIAVGEKQDSLAPEVARFVKAYKAIQSGIKNTPQKQGNAEDWKDKLGARAVYLRGHYALIYWDTPPEEVQRRAALLEENFRGFYLWHATRGVELPIPETPLVAVLAKKGADVLPMALTLDGPTGLPADGFYSGEHNLLVLSPERLDGVGQTFLRQTQQIYKDGVRREDLLAGKGPQIHVEGAAGLKDAKKPDEVAWMQTMALVERFVDENSAVHAVSREGSRQLLYATGQLPRYVNLPEWLSHGSVNVFARPKDPAFVSDEKGKWSVTVATGTGYGAPNYVLQRYLRDLADKKELNPDRAELLKNVLTDAYFAGLRDPREANDPDPRKLDTSGIALNSGGGMGVRPPTGGTPGMGERPPAGGSSLGPPPGMGTTPPVGGSSLGPPPPGGMTGMPPGMGTTPPPGTPTPDDAATKLRKSRERLAIKAQATSWALCHYLSRERPREYRKFLDELAALPRDLPLDGPVVVATFCRAFELDGSKDSLRRFADAWLENINSLQRVGYDILLVDPKPTTPATTGTGPMAPGGSSQGPRPGG
jgi:hypothetical protein